MKLHYPFFLRHSFFTIVALSFGFFVPVCVSASKFFDPNNFSSLGLGKKNPEEIVISIVNWALGLLALIAVTLILYAGFRWMLSRGNEEEVTKAKDILKAAFIGLAIILASAGIMQYVLGILIKATK